MPAITPYKTKNNETRFLLQAYLGTDKTTGKRVRVSRRGFLTEREALLEYSRLMLEHEQQGLKRGQPIRFEQVYEIWMDGYRYTVKESTLKRTMDVFRLHILPYLGNMIISAITIKEAQRAVSSWHDKLKNYRMIANYASLIMKEAMRQGIIEKNPFDLVIMPRLKKQVETEEKLNYYEKEELQAFLMAAKEHEGNLWYTFFRLLAFTGIRRGEALALTWDDINLSDRSLSISKTLAVGFDNQLIIQTPKTATGKRSISLDEGTVEILRKWKKDQLALLQGYGHNPFSKNQLLFHTKKNTHMSLQLPTHAIDRIHKRTGLRRISVHGFRHSHCSLLFEAGLSIKEVQDRLGHSDIHTTMNIYTHVTQKKRDDVADKFAQFVSF